MRPEGQTVLLYTAHIKMFFYCVTLFHDSQFYHFDTGDQTMVVWYSVCSLGVTIYQPYSIVWYMYGVYMWCMYGGYMMQPQKYHICLPCNHHTPYIYHSSIIHLPHFYHTITTHLPKNHNTSTIWSPYISHIATKHIPYKNHSGSMW